MTQHNITGSEAFTPSAHVLVRRARRQRRPIHPGLKLCAIAGGVGAVASLLDALIGAPVFLGLVSIFALILWLQPTH